MSANSQQNGQVSPILKEKKFKRETNRKKKSSAELEQSTLIKQPNEKQMLLTKFCKKTSASINETTCTNSEEFLSVNVSHTILQDELRKKDEVIKRLYVETQTEQQKNCKAKQEYLDYCNKAKQALLESKKELAQIRRKQNGEIRTKYGHYRDQFCTNFIEGEYLTEIRTKIVKTQEKIREFQAKKLNSPPEEIILVNSRLNFIVKELGQLKQELRVREKEVDQYKQQIKLFFKTQNCTFAKDQWPLLKNRYQPLYFIASGGFGQVYLGYDIEKYQDVAIKICNLDKLSSEVYEITVKHLIKQIDIHRSLSHPNIVKMIDQLELEGNRIGLVMEYCTGPQLKAYLKKEGCLDERQAKFIVKQLVYAIKYLKEHGDHSVVHYDLKPANILFHHGTIKIVDFGISKKSEGEDSRIELTSKAGTYYYLPPETFLESGTKIANKIDIWSIGVIFFEMLYGKKPFGQGLSQQKILATGEILKAHRVDFPKESPKNYPISQQAKDFIKKCLKYFPEQRISASQAYEDDYIKY